MKKTFKNAKSVAVALSPLVLCLITVIIFAASFGAVRSEFYGYFGILSLFDGAISEAEPEAEPTSIFDEFAERDENAERVFLRDIQFPKYGEQYGMIYLDKKNVKAKLYYGTTDAALARGVAQHFETSPIGFGSSAFIGGHNNTAFNALQYYDVGDEIRVETSYGIYTYTVTKTEIKNYKEFSYKNDISRDKDEIILYTCYPFTTLGLTKLRFFLYADLTNGPVLVRE